MMTDRVATTTVPIHTIPAEQNNARRNEVIPLPMRIAAGAVTPSVLLNPFRKIEPMAIHAPTIAAAMTLAAIPCPVGTSVTSIVLL
jgi:hypothetical protein